jgi:lysophospholipase L1-like esterase
MKATRILTYALLLALAFSLLALPSCSGSPTPSKRGEIADITRGYFGDLTAPITLSLSEYVEKNGADVSFTVTSSNPAVARASLSGDSLKIDLLAGEGSAEITVSVKSGKKEAFSLSFTVNAASYTRIACIGDSLTYGHSWPEESWPVYLSALLGEDFTVGNFGRNGASICGYNPTGYLKYTEQTEYTASMDFAPDILVVMLGTNDAKDWAPAEPEFISTYIDLLDSYLRAYPDLKILLVTAPPTMENNRFNLPNDVITNEVVPLQRDLAALLELPLLDLSAIMHEADGGYGAFLRGDAAFDGVHLSVAGAQLVAQLVAESIASF